MTKAVDRRVKGRPSQPVRHRAGSTGEGDGDFYRWVARMTDSPEGADAATFSR